MCSKIDTDITIYIFSLNRHFIKTLLYDAILTTTYNIFFITGCMMSMTRLFMSLLIPPLKNSVNFVPIITIYLWKLIFYDICVLFELMFIEIIMTRVNFYENLHRNCIFGDAKRVWNKFYTPSVNAPSIG